MSITINTNMSAIKTQHALSNATNRLNTAIERMTTGYKINSAKDDAAGFAIATTMETKLSSYDVAKQNVAMGTSLVDTATNSMDILNDHLQRIRDLCEQAANGTYSSDSRTAIQTEIDQRVEEINRVMDTTEYNGIKLLNKVADDIKSKGIGNVVANKGPNGKFIADVDTVTPTITCDKTNTTTAADLKTKIQNSTGAVGIADAETLALLAEVVNGGYDCSGKTICLTDDIDLSAYGSSYNGGKGWTPIGTRTNQFKGNFNGNGHVVSNLYINNRTDYQGLFGFSNSSSSTIKNVGIENCNIIGAKYTGGLVGRNEGKITNSYVTGNVEGTNSVGGLVGEGSGFINSYATGDVTGTGENVGGLVGYISSFLENSYATGDVSGQQYVGGLAGFNVGFLENSYATGDVSGDSGLGGLAGWSNGNITNSYSTGDVSGDSGLGGLVGGSYSSYTQNSTSYSQSVTGASKTGSFIGDVIGPITITNCQTQEIDGLNKIGSGGTEAQKNGITYLDFSTTLQVGITSSENSRLSFRTDLYFGTLSFDVSTTDSARAGLDTVDTAMKAITTRQTELGAIQNRLDSITESIDVSIENLTSSLSTIKDADIAKESSEYINAQILQQASATLLATANQSPSIALQLI